MKLLSFFYKLMHLAAYEQQLPGRQGWPNEWTGKKTNTVVEIQTVFIEPVPALYNG